MRCIFKYSVRTNLHEVKRISTMKSRSSPAQDLELDMNQNLHQAFICVRACVCVPAAISPINTWRMHMKLRMETPVRHFYFVWQQVEYRSTVTKNMKKKQLPFLCHVTSNKTYDFACFMNSSILYGLISKCVHILIVPILCTLQKHTSIKIM